MDWYIALENCSIQHRGETIEPGKKIWLSEDLADLHNSLATQIELCPDPSDANEAAVKEDWLEYQASLTSSSAVA